MEILLFLGVPILRHLVNSNSCKETQLLTSNIVAVKLSSVWVIQYAMHMTYIPCS